MTVLRRAASRRECRRTQAGDGGPQGDCRGARARKSSNLHRERQSALHERQDARRPLRACSKRRSGRTWASRCRVMVRTARELAEVVKANPFADEPGSKVVAIFLEAKPPKDSIGKARGIVDERLALGRREIYVHFPSGMGRSKLKLAGAVRRNGAQHEQCREARGDGEGGRMSKQTQVPLEFEGEELEGVFVGRRDAQARPTVMLIPTVMGVSDLELGFAKQLVELGYNGFVADIFGKKFRGVAARRDVRRDDQARQRPGRAPAPAAGDRRAGARAATKSRTASWSSPAIASAGKCALDVARTGADIARRVASTGCSIRPTGRPRRSRRKSSRSTAGTTRWRRPTMSSRWARS